MPRQKKIDIVVPDITTVQQAEELLNKAHSMLHNNIVGGIVIVRTVIDFYKQINNNELLAKALSLLHVLFAYQRNVSKQARHWVKIAEKLLKQIPDILSKAELHYRLCPYFTATGQKEKAIFHYRQAEKIYSTLDKMPSAAYVLSAQMFLELQEYEQGWQALLKAEEQLCDEIQQSKKQAISTDEQQKLDSICAYCCNIWCLYFSVLSEVVLHSEYAIAGYKFIQQYEFMPVKINVLGILADSAIAHNETEKIAEIAQQLNNIYVQYKIHVAGVQSYLLFAYNSNNEKKHDKALFYAYQALDIARKYCDKSVRMLPILRIIETLLQTEGDNHHIQELLDECDEILQQLHTPYNRKKYYHLRILWAEKTQQYELMPEYVKKLFALPQPEYFSLLREKFYKERVQQTKTLLQQSEYLDYLAKPSQSNNGNKTVYQEKNVVKQNNYTFSTPDILDAIRSTVADLATQLYLLNERSIQKNLKILSNILDEHIREPELLKSIEQELHSVHSEYLLQLAKLVPSLTHTELRISVFLRLNLNTHQIAALMGISPDTVYTHRKSIRKKLGISHRKSLNMFLLTLQQ